LVLDVVVERIRRTLGKINLGIFFEFSFINQSAINITIIAPKLKMTDAMKRRIKRTRKI
jgi:hypothetical protein